MAGARSVFISFDYDNDRDLPGNLVAQAARSDSPFSITDRSVRAPIDENWRREVRARIRRVDLVIVICGENTHDADGVAGEVTITQEEKEAILPAEGAQAKDLHQTQECPHQRRDSQLDLGQSERTHHERVRAI